MKKRLSIVLVVVLTVILLLLGSTLVAYARPWPSIHEIKSLSTMEHYAEYDVNCGPCSGTSIGQYYEDSYPNLPLATDMCDRLYEYMDTTIFGSTTSTNYGPGFVEMALHYGYDNFSYAHHGTVTAGDYDTIVNAINNGYPIALAAMSWDGFSGVEEIYMDPEGDPDKWPVTSPHWIAIKGYEYWYHRGRPWYNERLICTDSVSHASTLKIGWDDLIDEVGANNLRAVIIEDRDTPDPYGSFVEDFEWGIVISDGISLEDWQEEGGEVDWEVSASGDSVVEIDDDEYYNWHTGSSRSARFYKYTSSPSAYYSLLEPSYIRFELKKDDTAEARFRIGNGDYNIWFRANTENIMQYYDGEWNDVATVYPDWENRIEFKDIQWAEGTYDIWVRGTKRENDADMRGSTSYNGVFRIWNYGDDYSEFWIDDIVDLVPRTEDFEWGDDGDDLEAPDAIMTTDWEVDAPYLAEVEIETDEPYKGTRCGRWYRYSETNWPQAWFTQSPVDATIGFYLKMEGGATAVFSHGDGEHRIYFLVQTDGEVVYVDEETYLSFDTWYHFEIKDIDWDMATYDVWLDGELIGDDIAMLTSSWCDGQIRFYSNSGKGTFWVDYISITPNT